MLLFVGIMRVNVLPRKISIVSIRCCDRGGETRKENSRVRLERRRGTARWDKSSDEIDSFLSLAPNIGHHITYNERDLASPEMEISLDDCK